MPETNSRKNKLIQPRRLALLASVAGLGVAILVAGPGGYLPMKSAGLVIRSARRRCRNATSRELC